MEATDRSPNEFHKTKYATIVTPLEDTLFPLSCKLRQYHKPHILPAVCHQL